MYVKKNVSKSVHFSQSQSKLRLLTQKGWTLLSWILKKYIVIPTFAYFWAMIKKKKININIKEVNNGNHKYLQ